MGFKGKKPHLFIFIFVLFFAFACSTPSWFPLKKIPLLKSKTKTKELAKIKGLADKEVIIIDKEEYVKVQNPKATEGTNLQGNPKYLYIPVNEYLAKKETYASFSYRKEEPKKTVSPSSGELSSSSLSSPSSPSTPSTMSAGGQLTVSAPGLPPGSDFKKKVVIPYFDDRTAQADEAFGDWITEKLMTEVGRRSQKVLFVDYPMIKEFIEGRGIPLTDLEKPPVLQLLSEVFGIQTLIDGHLAGPYAFVAKGEKDAEGTASAIIKIEMKLIDTLTGKTVKNLEATNPILGTRVKGSFSEEKAKTKAIEVTIANLVGPLSRELDSLDWFCRIVKIEGELFYLNAGRLTGVKEGDVMEVFYPPRAGQKGKLKGQIRIVSCFGLDAAMGQLIQGERPEVDDILKVAGPQGSRS